MTEHHATSFLSRHAKYKRVFALQCLAGVAGLAALLALSSLPEPVAAVTGESDQFLPVYSQGTTGNYLAGRFAANTGDFQNANLFLNRTLRYDPENLEIAGYAYRMHLITGNMERAVKMAESLHAAGDVESNPEIMLLLAYAKSGEYAKAREVLATFDESGFNLVVLPLMKSWLDFAEGKLAAPAKQDEALKRIADFAPFIYYQTALINDLAGFEEEALAQYNEALTLSKNMPYRVVEMLGNLYQRRGEKDKAEKLFARYREENPDSMLMAGNEHASADMTKAPPRLVGNMREGIAEIFFSTASILHNEGLNEEALIYIQQVLYLRPDFAAAQLMRGTIYEDLGRYDAALAVYDNLPLETAYYLKGQLRKAYTLNALGRTEEALDLLDRFAGKAGNAYQVQLTRGDILMRAKRYGEASEAYTSALAFVGALKADHWPILYARGISYERVNDWAKAETDFLKALEIEPGQPDVLNYLGYSWLTQNMRLPEAKQMIERAVAARPTDAHIIDSMGWALYALGDYPQSIDYLERAIELMPTDPTVNDHLGDAYWRVGRKTEARFQWKRALLFGPEQQQAEALARKLANGLPPLETLQTAENDGKQQRVEVRRN